MRCPACGREMTASSRGWLCLACGKLVDPTSRQSAAPAVPAGGSTNAANTPVLPAATTMSATIQLKSASSRRRRIIVFWFVIAALIGVMTIGGYITVFEPKVALSGYIERVINVKTARFGLAANINESSSSPYRLTGTGQFDVSNANNLKTDLALKITEPAASTTSAQAYGGQVRFIGNNLYLKPSESALPGNIVPANPATAWYKLSLGERSSSCLAKIKTASHQLAAAFTGQLPVAQAAFKGVELASGAPRLHYAGTIDAGRLPPAVAALNRQLPTTCQLNLPASAYAAVTASYEVWRGWSADRLLIALSGGTSSWSITFTLTTDAYNQPAAIAPPANVQDMGQTLSGLIGN